MSFFVVVTKQNRFLVLKPNWVQNPTIARYTKVYYSADEEKEANYQENLLFYVNLEVDACYDAFVVKHFRDRESAEWYTQWKRPHYPIKPRDTGGKFKFENPVLVDRIVISDSDSDVDGEDNRAGAIANDLNLEPDQVGQ